jgi:KaiC/GvpD/RAD55 family RecA-like ATPase
MSLQIKETANDNLALYNSKNNLDQILAKDIPEPLPNYSGFSMLICGASGSGKTTALYSMMSAGKKKGVRQSYKKCFHKIYIVSVRQLRIKVSRTTLLRKSRKIKFTES